ncbi:MAG: hypothetical protein ACREPY_16870 [Rhodanobacteraceae bacterium]
MLAVNAASTQTFSISGQAQFFLGGRRVTTPFMGTMQVNPNFADPTFGIIGKVVSIAISFPVLPEAGTFDRILTQGPEISGVTPLKYDVTMLNAKGEQAQIQFTTVQSPAKFPGLGTPMGSLIDFQGGSFMQGTNTGAIAIGNGQTPIFLQNFAGRLTPSS